MIYIYIKMEITHRGQTFYITIDTLPFIYTDQFQLEKYGHIICDVSIRNGRYDILGWLIDRGVHQVTYHSWDIKDTVPYDDARRCLMVLLNSGFAIDFGTFYRPYIKRLINVGYPDVLHGLQMREEEWMKYPVFTDVHRRIGNLQSMASIELPIGEVIKVLCTYCFLS